MNSALALLSHSIDYAGLFPPASLDMKSAVKNYAAYLESLDVWMLGRFIVPVSRLEEFESAALNVLPRDIDSRAWGLSVLGGDNLHEETKKIVAFNDKHWRPTNGGRAIIDAVEIKAHTQKEIQQAASLVPKEIAAYFEIPISDDPASLIDMIADAGGRAKVRTGGITQDAFPKADDLVHFTAKCVRAGVPFKATAGLHHPIRSTYPLTYEKDSPKGMMYGFLNLLLASAFIFDGVKPEEAVEVLEEESKDRFRFEDDGINWRKRKITNEKISATRRTVVISFGSCSFREPTDELKSMDLL
ncbi:MAG: hypothetical protein O7D34_10045 [Ignavibacteria bacterium]|nr:hypothetical protein [Ignavibacteria bacterium]